MWYHSMLSREKYVLLRCELSRSVGYDPTGEDAVVCGARAEYCEVCEVNVCPDCHDAIATEQCLRLKKAPARAKTQTDNKSSSLRA